MRSLHLEFGKQAFHDRLHITDNGHLSRTHLADFGRVDVDVYDLGIGRELFRIARHAIGKPRTQGDDKIGPVQRAVRELRAVHAHRPHVQLVGSRHCALRHKGRHGGNAVFAHQATNDFARV